MARSSVTNSMDRSGGGRASTRGAARGARGIWLRLAILVFLLPLAAVILPTTLLLGALLLPTLVALAVDRTPNRDLTITIGLVNGAGSLAALLKLWNLGHSLQAAQFILGDPITWMMAYGAAALGWGFYLGLPPTLRRYYAASTEGRVRSLRKRQQKLRTAWGDEVAAQVEAEERAKAQAAGPGSGRTSAQRSGAGR